MNERERDRNREETPVELRVGFEEMATVRAIEYSADGYGIDMTLSPHGSGERYKVRIPREGRNRAGQYVSGERFAYVVRMGMKVRHIVEVIADDEYQREAVFMLPTSLQPRREEVSYGNVRIIVGATEDLGFCRVQGNIRHSGAMLVIEGVSSVGQVNGQKRHIAASNVLVTEVPGDQVNYWSDLIYKFEKDRAERRKRDEEERIRLRERRAEGGSVAVITLAPYVGKDTQIDEHRQEAPVDVHAVTVTVEGVKSAAIDDADALDTPGDLSLFYDRTGPLSVNEPEMVAALCTEPHSGPHCYDDDPFCLASYSSIMEVIAVDAGATSEGLYGYEAGFRIGLRRFPYVTETATDHLNLGALLKRIREGLTAMGFCTIILRGPDGYFPATPVGMERIVTRSTSKNAPVPPQS